MLHKILITGTGRAGTSIIVAILSLLEYKTGFSADNIWDYMSTPQKAGLECFRDSADYIHKQPLASLDIFDQFAIDHVIIPMRNIEHSAKSREKVQGDSKKPVDGGFVRSTTYQQQIHHNANYLGFLFSLLVDRDIPYTIIKFPKLVYDDGAYLFEQLLSPFPDLKDKQQEYFKVFREIVHPEWINF